MATLDQTNAYIDALEQSTTANNDANLATQQSALSDRAAAYQQMLAQQKQGASEAVQQATTPNLSQTNQSRLYGSYLNEVGNAQATQRSMQTNLDYLGTVARNVNSINNLNTQINSWSAKAAALIDAYNASSSSSRSGTSSYTFSDQSDTTATGDSTDTATDTTTKKTLTGSKFGDVATSLNNSILGRIGNTTGRTISSLFTNEDKAISKAINFYANKYSGDTSESATQQAYSLYNMLNTSYNLSDEQREYIQDQLEKVQYGD